VEKFAFDFRSRVEEFALELAVVFKAIKSFCFVDT